MKILSLDDWNLGYVKELLEGGYSEDREFEFKSALPTSDNKNGRLRIRTVVASFANSHGGILIFGVKDKADKALDRIVGVPKNEEYPVLFGNLITCLVPRPDYRFKNPPIDLGGGKVLQVCQVLESYNKPCAYEEDNKYIFPIRTTKGTDYMRYEEIRENFIGYAHMRDKLYLLEEELVRIYRQLEWYSLDIFQQLKKGYIGGQIKDDIIITALVNSRKLLKEENFMIHNLNEIMNDIEKFNSAMKLCLARCSNTDYMYGSIADEFAFIPENACNLKTKIEAYLPELKKFLERI